MEVQWNDKLDRPPLCYLWHVFLFLSPSSQSVLFLFFSTFDPLFFPNLAQQWGTTANCSKQLPYLSVLSPSVSNTWHFLASLFLSPSLHHILISLSLHPFPFIFTAFVVLHPTLHFQMWSLPVLISCYFPQSSCSSSLSHFLLSIPHSF